MKTLERNDFGQFQQFSGGFRIVRDGDWCVSHRGRNEKSLHALFKRLGAGVKRERRPASVARIIALDTEFED